MLPRLGGLARVGARAMVASPSNSFSVLSKGAHHYVKNISRYTNIVLNKLPVFA